MQKTLGEMKRTLVTLNFQKDLQEARTHVDGNWSLSLTNEQENSFALVNELPCQPSFRVRISITYRTTCTCHLFNRLAVTDCQLRECREENAFGKSWKQSHDTSQLRLFWIYSQRVAYNYYQHKLPSGQRGTLRKILFARASSDATIPIGKFPLTDSFIHRIDR
jgi:hypothetical protein